MIDRPIIEKSIATGERKSHLLKTDPGRYIMRAVLAGMYLSIVVFTYWALQEGLHDSPFGKVIASAFFGVGLTMIVLSNTELFTSNNMYMAVSSAEGRTSWTATLKLWTVCWLGNFAGAIIVALLLLGAGTLTSIAPDHALYTGAEHKVHQGALAIFVKGVLANWIVCLAVRLAMAVKEDIAKVAVLICVVFIFLYLGFEHSIANMGTFSMVMLGHGGITFGEAAFNLLFATLGNIAGGALLVGLPVRYINPRPDDDTPGLH
ncbi:MAG: formate/nitrite transporter family protein [Candidatus Dactylopiibacterium sp.]|nr:formate/nitrite transporter family protein [Candidatus Dactylopiibacterium sp.]